MLPQQVVRPRDAPCGASLDSPRSAFEENTDYLEKYYDNQSISSNNADVNFDAHVQKREELSVQPIPDATRRNLQSMGLNPIIHSAASNTVDLIRELFRHTLLNCNAGSESPLFSRQRHHYP